MSIGTSDRRAVRRGHKVEQIAPPTLPPDPATQSVVGAVRQVERQRLAWGKVLDGPDSEHITATSLQILERYGWMSLHERAWPGLPDVVDVHVAVGPGGVVIVAERAWTGHVVVEGDVLRHDGYRCESDLEQVHAAMGAVVALLAREHQDAVIGVIQVTTRDMAPAVVGGITVVGRLQLASLLVDLPQRLSPMDVADITRWFVRAVDRQVTPLAASGGAAVSSGTVFYPSNAGSTETASYFAPHQTSAPAVPVPPEYEDTMWAMLWPTGNRFGIR